MSQSYVCCLSQLSVILVKDIKQKEGLTFINESIFTILKGKQLKMSQRIKQNNAVDLFLEHN